MRILDVRGKDTSISKIEGQYNPRYYRQISTQTPHETTDADIKEFRERTEKEGAIVIFISNYGQSAYIPLKAGTVEPKKVITVEEIREKIAYLIYIQKHKPETWGDLVPEIRAFWLAAASPAMVLIEAKLQEYRPSLLPQTELLQYYKVPPSAF